MGAIGGLLGLNGGVNGTGQQGPSAASLVNPTTAGQANSAYTGTQTSMQQQQALLNAIQAQNGLGNQSQVYNQLQGVANGTGPNPAQAMLAQSTGQNVANQAALMAGQRGANSNAGLLARQAGQQGASTQQQAAGQAATLQANQSLNAIGQAGSIAGQQVANQVGQTNANTQAQQAEQGQLLNAIQGQNSNQVAMQSNINNANAGLASTTMQGQQGLLGGVLQGAGAAAGLAQGGVVKYADGGGVNGPQSSFGQFVNGVSAGGAPSAGSTPSLGNNSGAQALQQGTAKGIANAFGSNKSGEMTNASGVAPSGSVMMPDGSVAGPANNYGASQLSMPGSGGSSGLSMPGSVGSSGPSLGDLGSLLKARGGKVPAMVSPGERYLPPKEVKEVAKGKKSPLKAGEKIPGKPKHPGNDYRNDVVPKTLEAGGIVIPNKIMQSKDPAGEAHKFVSAIIAKQGIRGKK